jgi:protease-4
MVASGRVWTGAQAKQSRLVDVVGNFEDAVASAVKSAGLDEDYRVRYYPQYTPSFLEQIIDQVEEEESATAFQQELGSYRQLLEYWNEVKSFQGTQARMPYELKIQ